MSPWLKTRLLTLFCGAILIGTSYSYLHAQEDYGPPAKTPEAAASNFWKLLDVIRQPSTYERGNMDEAQLRQLSGSIVRAQFEMLRSSGYGDSSDKLINLLATQVTAPTLDTQVQSTTGDQTIVTVAPNPQPKAREIVVVREEGGYRVDVVATYGRWNNLSGIEADKALYKATGWISPALATRSEFMGASTQSQCQSNLKQIGLAILQYSQDYDERMPPARRWMTVTEPYLKNKQLYTCPAIIKKGNGYAHNSKLSQVGLAFIAQPASTVQVYETSNPSPNVFAPFTGRAYRHTMADRGLGMNISFSDGHVKWYKPEIAEKLNIVPTTTDVYNGPMN